MEKQKRKLIIEFIVIFTVGLIIFLAAVLTWFIYLRPFKEFKKFEMTLLTGENIIYNEERNKATIYYEIEGFKFEKKITSGLNDIGTEIEVYYQADDPTYHVGNRPLGLWGLPVAALTGAGIIFFAFRNNKEKQKKLKID